MLTVRKGKEFEKIVGDERIPGDEIKKRLETMFGKSFSSFEEIRDYMRDYIDIFPPTLQILDKKYITIKSLPVIVDECPIIYSRHIDLEVGVIISQKGSSEHKI